MAITKFKDIKIGGWFQELGSDTWYLKTSTTKAMYQSNGVEGEPTFCNFEEVQIEA